LLKLKRVEIHGFKSFYDRTEMKFSGRGIVAIVGPNGCGKSNLSDAINWVLGEQSAKSLRGTRMEEVIFAGTRDRKPLGMAAVTLTMVEADHRWGNQPAGTDARGDIRVDDGSEGNGGIAANTSSFGASHAESSNGGDSKQQNINGKVSSVAAPGAGRAAQSSGEVTITRRLYRSGESEYLINGKTARLRDIQDLFWGTGLGPESYAIIEQGRIGQILSNKPQDRRSVIEEAAGVTKFKTRKRLAEAKLEGAKQNLSRVFDILEEVTRQVNSLKRQAAKAKRYDELRGEMAGYLRRVLAGKGQMLERESARTAIELNFASAGLQDLQRSVGAKEEHQAKLVGDSYSIEKALTQARKQRSDLQLEAERVRSRLEFQLQQIEQFDRRLAAGATEATNLEVQEQQATSESEQHAVELTTLEEERASVRGALDLKLAERQEAQSRLSERERDLENARQEVMRLLNEASSLKNRVAQAEAQLASLDREGVKARSEDEQAQAELGRLQQVKREISDRLSIRQSELTSISDQRHEVELDLNSRRGALQSCRQNLDHLRAEFSRVKARKDSLEEVISHRSYTTETVKRLFTAIGAGQVGNFRPLGVVADFLEVDPQFEKAAEEFLHEELEYVVLGNWTEAERGIDLLKGSLDGRATFLVSESEDAVDRSAGIATPDGQEGVLGCLADVLKFANRLTAAPRELLPRVVQCYLTSNRNAAQQLATRYPSCWFLSPDGVSYYGRAVSGGKKTGAGPLALKRELRELAQLEGAKQRELDAEQARLTELEKEIANLTERLEVLRKREQAEERDVLTLDHESRKLAEEFQRTNSRLSSARLELERVSRERGKLQKGIEQAAAELQKQENARSAQEFGLEQSRAEYHQQQTVLARAAEEHSTLRANLASCEEKCRATSVIQARLEARLRETIARRESIAFERQSLSAERQQFLASNEELKSKGADLAASVADLDGIVRQLESDELALRSQISNTEDELKGLRAQMQSLHEQRSAWQVAMARMDSNLKHLEETCNNELQISLQQLVAGLDVVPSEVELAELDHKHQEIRQKIDALGPVNTQALEEFEEAQQRQEFLNTQRQDLLDSIRDLEKAIRDIDTESRKRFAEAFHAINTNFKQMFQTLFSGGMAEMRLTDEENVSESGIEIVASPPGKKLQSVLLLSGGEKALTAMALLMAVFEYTPSPFCVLDEVDAPLDEPNIQRLTRLLRAMSQQTQFVVITHAKRTMEAAQALYGVTMQEPGVSKLVSVDLKQDQTARNGERRRIANEAGEREEELVLA
jgi:chromosome segregation protein